MSRSIVWVTGASSGLGAAIAESVPFSGARVINISRRPHPEIESLCLDLSSPDCWRRLEEHFREVFTQFNGERALFVQSAYAGPPYGFAGEVPSREYDEHILVNCAAPLYLGHAYISACPPEVDSGLVLISGASASARMLLPGRAAYGAGKAAMEQWVRIVGRERDIRGSGPWVIAVRPGTVRTPGLRELADVHNVDMPYSGSIEEGIAGETAVNPAEAAEWFWNALSHEPASGSIVKLGELPPDLQDLHEGNVTGQGCA